MTDIDTRIRQAQVAVNDAMTFAADIQDEVDCPPLTDARHYLNWALSAFERAGAVLQLKAVPCKASPLGGGQCHLHAGHPGKHRRTSFPRGPEGEPFVFEWDDESQRRLADKQGSRFD